MVRGNKLTNLIGCPIKVGNDFWCDGNSITSLELGPEYVGRSYYCDGNKLTNLKGISKKIDGSLFCFSNKLTTLLDGPEEVNGNHFDLSNNSYIYDFYGFPEFYRGKVYLEFTPVSEVVKLFLGKTSNDIIIEILNEYRVIREVRKINAQLLKYAFDDVGLDFPENLYIKGYEII